MNQAYRFGKDRCNFKLNRTIKSHLYTVSIQFFYMEEMKSSMQFFLIKNTHMKNIDNRELEKVLEYVKRQKYDDTRKNNTAIDRKVLN